MTHCDPWGDGAPFRRHRLRWASASGAAQSDEDGEGEAEPPRCPDILIEAVPPAVRNKILLHRRTTLIHPKFRVESEFDVKNRRHRIGCFANPPPPDLLLFAPAAPPESRLAALRYATARSPFGIIKRY